MHDDDLPIIEDKYDLPVWYRYLTNTISRNAYYEVRIELNDDGRYLMIKRWGPLPDRLDNGQTRVQPYVDGQKAIRAANEIVHGKLQGDYREAERPHPW